MMEPPTRGEDRAGLDRRTVIRRGAILGGALVWTAPAVQTIAGPAFAAGSPCGPVAVLGYDRSNPLDGDFEDSEDACIGTFTYINGPRSGANCCACLVEKGEDPAGLTTCTASGDCQVAFSPTC